MEKLLELLNVPASERTFAHAEIAQGLVTGSSLLAPIPIFPRYIEAEEDHRKEVPVLIDSHCHLDFADFAAERDAVSNAPAPLGLGG